MKELYIINVETEVFYNGEYPEKNTLLTAFETRDDARKYVKQDFIPSLTEEKKSYYDDDDIFIKSLWEDEMDITLGIFSCDEQIERISIEIIKLYLQ